MFENSDMYSGYMKRIRFADAGFENSHMSIAVMHSGQFCDVQELRFETAKSSDKCCATLLEGLFVDAPKSSFQGAKNSNMGSNYVE